MSDAGPRADALAEIRAQAIANRRADAQMDPQEAQLRLDVFRAFVIDVWPRSASGDLSAVEADARSVANSIVAEARRLG